MPPDIGVLPAGGNGQGGWAVANAPLAAATLALLQKVQAIQQAIVGRLACVENIQAQPLQQQQQKVAAQHPDGAPLGGLRAPWA